MEEDGRRWMMMEDGYGRWIWKMDMDDDHDDDDDKNYQILFF